MKDKKLVAGITVGILATLCCLGPVIGGVLGLSILSNFTFFEPLRPYLLVLLVVLLGFTFYKTFITINHCDDDSSCSTNSLVSIISFAVLSLITIIAFAAPYLAQYFGSC